MPYDEDDIMDTTYHDSVLKFDPASLVWQQVGVMRQARSEHGISVVKVADIQDYCL